MEKRREILASLTEEEAEALLYDWPFWARPDQLAPPGEWTTWLLLAGRGFGKTRAGAEWIRQQVCGTAPLAPGKCRRVAIVAEDAKDARDVMILGESGILAISPPGFRPRYSSNARRLEWPNGALGHIYSAHDPEELRGPQHDGAWCDELPKWRYAEETWDQLQFGLRLGNDPRQVVTSTPRPVKVLRQIIADTRTVVTRGTTYDNRANLAGPFLHHIIKRYEGTRLGRQELEGHLLDDMPGALWSRGVLDKFRVRTAEERSLLLSQSKIGRRVVAIDPPTTSGEDADECGIVVVGLGADGHGYVLEDVSVQGLSPKAWAERAVGAYHGWNAHLIVAETNQGGEMVEAVIREVDHGVAYKAVHAKHGKVLRAEPVAALYEQGRVHHLGTFAELEDQMCVFTTDHDPSTMGSPDRVDALVYAITELMIKAAPPPKIWRV